MKLSPRLRASIEHQRPKLVALPFFFTFANAALGLLSIVKALDAEYITAAYCILLAAFMDSLDGRIARALGLTTPLGMELDSLCDAISFCLAPAVLLYVFSLHDFGVLGLCAITLYLCAGLFRLARFNTLNQEQESYFLGLPTPLGAFIIICLVLYHDWLAESFMFFVYGKYWLMAVLIGIATLMVSSIMFPSFKQARMPRRTTFIKTLPLALICGLAVQRGYPVIGFALFAYLIYSISSAAIRFGKRYHAINFDQPQMPDSMVK